MPGRNDFPHEISESKVVLERLSEGIYYGIGMQLYPGCAKDGIVGYMLSWHVNYRRWWLSNSQVYDRVNEQLEKHAKMIGIQGSSCVVFKLTWKER